MPSTSASASASSQWANLSFVEVLEDLSSRFIVNLPSEELQRIERICFQVEQAHWFYEDFLRPLNSSLPSLNLRKFSIYILQTASLTVPLIRQYISSGSGSNNGATVQWEDLGGATYGLEAAFDEFLKYKTRVPVCGAVLLSDDWKSVSSSDLPHRIEPTGLTNSATYSVFWSKDGSLRLLGASPKARSTSQSRPGTVPFVRLLRRLASTVPTCCRRTLLTGWNST